MKIVTINFDIVFLDLNNNLVNNSLARCCHFIDFVHKLTKGGLYEKDSMEHVWNVFCPMPYKG